MWWPFAKRGTRIDAAPDVLLPVGLPSDLSVFGINNACIKLWLPEKLTLALDSLSASHSMSRPDVLRHLLFEHVYGRPALEQLKDWKRRKDEEDAARARAEQEPHVQFSPARAPAERTITAQLLGKSVEDFKLWLPCPLKAELEALATLEELGLSDYLRKTLVRILLGESFHHKWRDAVGKLPEEVKRFEQSDDGLKELDAVR